MKNIIVLVSLFLFGCATTTQLVPIPEMPRVPAILMKAPQELKPIETKQPTEVKKDVSN